MSRVQRRRDRRRQELVHLARQIIARKGISGLTVQDVTEAADMAVGSFYTYFPSKEALLEAAIWEDLQRLGDPDNPAVQDLPLDQRRQAQLHQTFAFVEAHRELMQAVFGPGGSPEQLERGMALLERRVREGIAKTTPLPESVIEWMAPLLSGLIAGGIRYLLAHPEVSAAEMAARTVSLLRPIQAQLASPGRGPDAASSAPEEPSSTPSQPA